MHSRWPPRNWRCPNLLCSSCSGFLSVDRFAPALPQNFSEESSKSFHWKKLQDKSFSCWQHLKKLRPIDWGCFDTNSIDGNPHKHDGFSGAIEIAWGRRGKEEDCGTVDMLSAGKKEETLTRSASFTIKVELFSLMASLVFSATPSNSSNFSEITSSSWFRSSFKEANSVLLRRLAWIWRLICWSCARALKKTNQWGPQNSDHYLLRYLFL